MNHCGIDLGKNASHFCIVDDNRVVIERGKVATREEALRIRFGTRPPMRIVIEATSKCFWVADLLMDMGHEVIIADPGHTKAIGYAKIKHDKLDAKVLAMLGQADLVVRVAHQPREERLKRMQLTARDGLVRQRTVVINLIRSLLNSEGIVIPPCSTYALRAHIPELPKAFEALIEPYLVVLTTLEEQIAVFDERLKAMAKEKPIVARLKTAPGVGDLVALAFALTIQDPKRFRTGRQVAAYLGLVPQLNQSCHVKKQGRITKRGNSTVRWLLTMAANALLRTKTTSALKEWGLERVANGGRKKGVVAIARKLAVTLWAMWRDERNFEPRVKTPAVDTTS